MDPKLTGAHIRQTFIDFFIEHGHTFVPSMSLVPGGDATLLFTNAGMVQFKDVFLGTDKRPYNRAVDSQKCMRVAGKHNDLEDVGRDDIHHTFFEMLGNWSFGNYYKKEAIAWAWQLLTDIWRLPKEHLWATCFKDAASGIPPDEDAAEHWLSQPGFDPKHVQFFGRKDNFWEMAETGPCGPCSEIHLDRGEDYCDKKHLMGHVCGVNHDCKRFLELWNLVFIQYNRTGPDTLEPLPATHVDTGMSLERIVSVLQNVDSNYKTDLFMPMIETLRQMTGEALDHVYANFTPYRVITDHARAAAFLIADGVMPGNTGRNYVCRMIIRRAARFGTKIGLHEPFLIKVAEAAVETYGSFYPELIHHRQSILDSLKREEIRFARTVESGTAQLQNLLDDLQNQERKSLDGNKAFELYATYGLPFEITRDIAREQDLDVDETGFRAAMEEHRLTSGGGKAMGLLGGEDAKTFTKALKDLQAQGKIGIDGVAYDPYTNTCVEGEILALFVDGQLISEAQSGDRVEVLLPRTGFYIEAGGQVSDMGTIRSINNIADNRSVGWEIEILDMRRPAAGVILHVGEVVSGKPRLGDKALAEVDMERRHDIMRNHTATHLLHAELIKVLGEHARQAGSLVAPDHLRFDFNHPEALTQEQLERIEAGVNQAILEDMRVLPEGKSRERAIAEGAVALFGEKYGENVRTITIGDLPDNLTAEQKPGSIIRQHPYSYELCGGTHLERTSDVGMFIIVNESSAAAGIRRIEAVTGRGAYDLISRRFHAIKQVAALISATPDSIIQKVEGLLGELGSVRKHITTLRQEIALTTFNLHLPNPRIIKGVPVLAFEVPLADADTLRMLADRYRQKYPSGVCVLASVTDERPLIIAAITDDLVKRGLNASDLVKYVASPLGGSGGGKPTLAQAGGTDATNLDEALSSVTKWVEGKI